MELGTKSCWGGTHSSSPDSMWDPGPMQAILEKGLALPEPSQVTPKRSPEHSQEALITG